MPLLSGMLSATRYGRISEIGYCVTSVARRLTATSTHRKTRKLSRRTRYLVANPSVTASGFRRQPCLIGLRKLDEVLKNKLRPSASSSLDERTAFCELSQPDWREAELFNQVPHRCRRAFVLARKEHDPPPSLDVRVLRENSRGEMVEGLHQSCAG